MEKRTVIVNGVVYELPSISNLENPQDKLAYKDLLEAKYLIN
jgi:hypothetical protein